MVDRAVADAAVVHAAHDALEGLDVLGRVAVEFDVADVARVAERVVRRLDADLVVRADGIPDRNVEGVGVVLAVRDAGDLAVALAVHADEAAGQALGGRGEQGEVHAHGLGLVVAEIAHALDDHEALLLHGGILGVVMAVERGERLRQADEAEGERAVLEHFAHLVIGPQLVRVEPYALPHQEGIVVHALLRLDLEAVEQLLRDQLEHVVQLPQEQRLVPLAVERKARQVDGGEGQVAAGESDLLRRIVDVAHHAGAAAHGGDLRLGATGHVILEVVGAVQEGVVREQALGRDLAGEAEQIVVRIALVVVDALLHLEDVDREDAGLAVAEAGVQREQDVADDHPALGRRVRAVVDGGERRLRAGARMHRVQVVDEALHRLIGLALRGLLRAGAGTGAEMLRRLPLDAERLEEVLRHQRVKALCGHERILSEQRLRGVHRGVHRLALLVLIQTVLDDLRELSAVLLAEGLADALRHAVIEVRDGLAAVLVVLVGLDRDGRQRRVAADGLGLAQEAVAGREAVLEQADDVDLRAGGRERVEIEIVDVDVSLAMRLGVLRTEQVRLVVGLRARRADLQHRAHGGVAVDVGVVALEVGEARVLAGDLVDGLHQARPRLARAGARRAIKDVRLRRAEEFVLHELLLDDVLDHLDLRRLGAAAALQRALDGLCHARGVRDGALPRGLHGAEYRKRDLFAVVGDDPAVPLDDHLYHCAPPESISCGRFSRCITKCSILWAACQEVT